MSQKRERKNSRGIKIWISWLFLLALFCFFSVPAAQSQDDLDGIFLKAWIKGNGKQININNGQLKVAKLKKKDYEFNVKLKRFDCDEDEGSGFTKNDCDGNCYDIIILEPDLDFCDEEEIGELYTCGEDEKTGSAIIYKDDDEDPDGFVAAFAFITKQVFKKDGTLIKLESKAGSGYIDDKGTLIEPDSVYKNVLLKATEIREADLDCTPNPPPPE